MKKELWILVVLLILLCFLVSCSERTPINTEKSKKDVYTNISLGVEPAVNGEQVHIWTDAETGVQYIIYSYSDGINKMGGITPRLNPDGSVCCDGK